jgi:hypothetical protein
MKLSSFNRPGRFYRGNIHTHSTNSDGRLPPEEVCRAYRRAGYDFLMISDHFLPEYRYPVTDTTHYRRDGFTTLIGAELHAPSTSHGDLWHIVAAGLPLDFAPLQPGEDAFALASRAHAAGAFLGFAHPNWSGLSVEEARQLDFVHAVEIYNHGSEWDTDRGDGSYLLDALSSGGRRLSCYAVDDAHFHKLDSFGGWMMVKAEANEPDAIISAMKAGDYYSTQGPEIKSITIEGDEIVVRSSPVCSIAVLGRGCRSPRLSGGQFTRFRTPLAPFRDSWFRVALIGADGKRAWSNPVWLTDQ